MPIRLPSAQPGGSSTTHSASNEEIAPVPIPPPDGENNGALVLEPLDDPMVGSFQAEPMYSPMSPAEIMAAFEELLYPAFQG
jgi:hypothetical protein